MWERRYDFFPTCESFLTLKLAASLDYMDCFRHNGKSYLLPASKRSRQHRRRRLKRGRINPRSGDGDEAGLTFAPFALEDLIAVQPLGQCGESSLQPLTQPRGTHNRRLGHDRSQPRRKETKLVINLDV
ncbi:hypothetical protein Godav_002926 [Gossypium davidsonii]|uniref:Uncharacterized protein n=1 Tax=Gossypium davidsonii TaxID=34287 RepID=A0A7J8SY54_GOSDV|nr:hypothetical protein [Gossypium davidsonii]